MLFSFIERLDHGTRTIATVRVTRGGKVLWEGEKAKEMRFLLTSKPWELLGGLHFDQANAEHWRKLPELLTGTRLWIDRLE